MIHNIILYVCNTLVDDGRYGQNQRGNCVFLASCLERVELGLRLRTQVSERFVETQEKALTL